MNRALRFTTPLILLAAAFVLYRPALRIGLLSDDFALLMWARRLELAPRDWGQIRPLPIAAWSLIAQLASAGRTPAALHGLNIALHGLNAALVWTLARRLTTSAWTAAAAGALFVVMPVSVEPVAWGSGVFDVMLTTSALLLAVVVTARQPLRPADQALCLLLAMLMLAAKETGVIAGPLALLLYWARWSRLDRSVLTVAAVQLLLAGSYTLARELTGRLDHRLVPSPDVASAWRLVSGTARAFVVPLHHDVILAHPIIAVSCGVGVLLALSAWAVRCRHVPQAGRVAVLALAGTLLCVAPAIRLFGITPDLQGTRYVYLASAWWAIALASALLDGWTARPLRIAAALVTILVIGSAAWATTIHLRPWATARGERDRILRALISLPPTCRRVGASGVADNVQGAYVFRNGLNEALATLGRSYEWVEPPQAAPECRVTLGR